MITRILAAALLLITPLVFAPFTINFFSINKNIFVIAMALVLLAATAFKHLSTKKHSHQASFFSLSLGIFLSIIALSIFLTPEAKIESLIGKGALLIALPIISYLIASSSSSKQSLKWALMALIGGGSALALHGILQLVLLADLAALPIWMKSFAFTPAGSVLALLTTVVFSFVATITWAFKEKAMAHKTTLFTLGGVQLAALVVYGLMLSQGKIAIQLLPLQAGWSLTLDALKNARELLIGIGLANFPVLFTQAKPAFLAQSNLWNIVFQNNSNEILQLLATTGVLGLGSFMLLIITTIKASSKLENTPLNLAAKLTTYVIILSFFLAPASVISYTFFFVLAGLIAANSPSSKHRVLNLNGHTQFVTALVIGIIVVVTGYFASRVYAAEVLMRKAQVAFAQNDAEGVYAAHIGAVQKMPQLADYRVSLSQINLTLASSLSGNIAPNAEGEAQELTEAQREQVSILIQRAIKQGQVAVQLRPSLYSTWQNLGVVYRNLINVAQGAENFAVQYLGQAVTKDPANPMLRVEYGGLFYQLSQLTPDEELQGSLLDQSIQQFQAAIQLKPDYANAYYNLANSLTKKGSYRLAYQAMTQAIANIDPDSADYNRAQEELLALEKMLPQDPAQLPANTEHASAQPKPSNLKQPAPLPTPLPGGLIEIPEEVEQIELIPEEPNQDPAATAAASPVVMATPSPTPTASPTP